MKKLFIASLSVLVAVVFCFLTTEKVFAANKNKQVTQTLQVFANDGTDEFNGSVLSPKEDEANVFLSKPLLAKIRKIGLRNLSVNLVSTVDSTKTYTVPNDAIVIQRKTLNKKPGKYLVVSLFNLTTLSGITISPSSLPNDTYKLTISGKELNATTASFIYRTPALIVGTARTENTGLVRIKDLQGNEISDKIVATNLNGTFFTEVRAKKITPNTKARRYLKAQTTEKGATSESTATEENTTVEEINAAVCEVTAEKELKAVVPLNNDPEINAAISSKPVEVNESSTLAANLAIKGAEEGNEELAVETAKAQLEGLQNTDETNDGFNDVINNEEDDLGCSINQFANRCSDNEESLISVGADFKKFLGSANCNFPEFGLIKKIILASPDSANSFIGKGYCEHVTREVNTQQACDFYPEILRRHETTEEPGLPPCPPKYCTQFQNIRPPKCFEPHGFCEVPPQPPSGPIPYTHAQVCRGPQCQITSPPSCIHKPMRDLYCARIGEQIQREECTSDPSNRYGPRWTIVKNSKGNEYCVPQNFGPPPPAIYSSSTSSNFKGQFIPPPYIAPPPPSYPQQEFTPPPPSTFTENFGPRSPEEIAEECELKQCHDNCAVKFGFDHGPMPLIYPGSPLEAASKGLSDCHFACEADAGTAVDCGNPLSKYFKKECCDPYAIGPIVYSQSTLAAQLSGYGGYSNQSFGGGKPGGYSGGYSPGGNYNPGRGPIRADVRGCLCQDLNNFDEKRYVKAEAQSICKNSCPKGSEKDPNSDQCLPICSEGAVRDPGGICRKKCPEGSFDDGTGYCRCPEGQSVGASGKCEVPTCPAYCKNYVASGFGSTPGNYSPTPYGTSSTPGYTSPGYTPSSYSSGYNPQTPGGSTYQIPPECQKCLGGGGGPASCPPGQIYIEENVVCVTAPCPTAKRCACPDRSNPGPNGQCGQNNICGNSNMVPNPNYTPGSNQAQCICPEGLLYWETNYNPTPNSGGGRCVAHCSNGDPPANASTNYPANSPIPCNGGYNSCPPATPIKCSDGSCKLTQAECTNSCPTATPYKCGDGTCATTATACPYTCPQATPYKCPNGTCATSSANCGLANCPAPYVTNPAYNSSNPGGATPCICPSDKSIQHNGNCVQNCPAGLTASYPPSYGSSNYSPMLSCLCPDKSYPNNGQCNTTTTNYCSPGIVPTAASPCTCNPAGSSYFGSGNTCTCPTNSGPYTKETGCTGSTSSHVCAAGEAATTSNPCYCAGGATFTGQSGTGTCQCTNGQTYTATGCGTTTTNYCAPAIVPTAASPCTCNPAGGAYFGSGNTCTCPTSSGPYTKETGCTPTTTSRPCTAGEGPSNNCYCFGSATVVNGTCQCPNNNNPAYTGGGCGTSSTNYCSPAILPTAANPCTCNPAGGSYFNSIGYCTCPSGSSTAYTVATGCGTSTASRPCTAGEGPSNNCYCFGSATVVNGTCQCPNNNNPAYTGGGCGTSTASHVCAVGEAATTANPCYCAGAATFTGPSGTGTCQCTDGSVYTPTGCNTSTACTGSTPIRCSDNTCAATQASCPCTGSTPIRCSDNTCAATQASCPNNSCLSPYVVNPSGTPPCKCPDATSISHNGTCVASCPSPFVVQTPSGGMPWCTCPTGQMMQNSNTCVACPACTGGKVFSGSGCTCSCPTGKTEVNGVCQ